MWNIYERHNKSNDTERKNDIYDKKGICYQYRGKKAIGIYLQYG